MSFSKHIAGRCITECGGGVRAEQDHKSACEFRRRQRKQSGHSNADGDGQSRSDQCELYESSAGRACHSYPRRWHVPRTSLCVPRADISILRQRSMARIIPTVRTPAIFPILSWTKAGEAKRLSPRIWSPWVTDRIHFFIRAAPPWSFTPVLTITRPILPAIRGIGSLAE